MPEPLDDSYSEKLAAVARAIAEHKSPDDAFEALLEGIRKIPEHLQFMVDSIVALQEEFPMPEEGWRRFVGDIERTNERLGINLRIREP